MPPRRGAMEETISEAVHHRDNGAARATQRNPLNLLILGGILLIAAIAMGTSFTIVTFRQRAMQNSERELQNTVLLLTRHFDRELDYVDSVQRDLIQRMKLTGIATPVAFRRQISGEDAHITLQTLVSGASGTARINIFDADGQLINSSVSWPVSPINIADRPYFKQFQTNPNSPEVEIALVHSRFARGWTTVIARKVVGPDGKLLGVVSRGMSPASFETFFQSLALGEDAAISMLHRDGTMLARYPHIEHMIGQNFSGAPAQKLLRETNHGSLRVQS